MKLSRSRSRLGTALWALTPQSFVLALAYRQRHAAERALERLSASEDARALAEERFRSLFEDAPYSILVVDPHGDVTMANAQAARMFGHPAGELIGGPVERFVKSDRRRPWYLAAPESAGRSRPAAELELVARRADGSEFPVEVSLTLLRTEDGALISAAIRDVTEVKQAAEALSHQARHDALTGLPNRVLFLERLELALVRARRSRRPLAVVFLDLDDFKLVNDTRGHDAGDLLLSTLTPRLSAAIRAGDTIARLGGDEFVVLCEDLAGEDDAIEIAGRIVEAAAQPIMVGGYEHTVSASAGVVMVLDPDVATANGVLRDADAAMYHAKELGKGRIAVFNSSMRERLLERIAVESALRGAAERGELELFYQPVLALARDRIVAIEALLRWQHPVRGLLAPADFMHVAESSGLIVEIGEWVLDEACQQAAAWRDAGHPLPVSVNVSAFQLARSDLACSVGRALARSGLDPHLLELEVTESTLLADEGATMRQLHRLKALGVRLVVDNFGTGYSSLPSLRDLMIDGLKLDRSFVSELERDGDDGALIDAVLSLAAALDAEVTAEGVETWAQVSRLRMHGCDFAQGYLFARPAPAEVMTERLADEFQREALAS